MARSLDFGGGGPLSGRRFVSLRSRLAIVSLALAIALVLLSLGVNWFLLRRVAREQMETALESVSLLLAHSSAPGLDFDSVESVRVALSGVFQIPSVSYAVVTDREGRIYEALGDPPPGGFAHGIPGQVEVARGKGLLVAHAPIRATTGDVIGALHVGYSTALMERDLQSGVFLLLCAGILLILVAVLLSRELGRRVTAPILELASAARSLAEGRYPRVDARAQVDEVGVVAAAFNDMAQRLEDSRREIERHNQELEQSVAERTAELRQKNLALALQNEQVLEASRLKSAFLANMSHELRTPLNAILALSEMIRDEISGALSTPEQRRQIQIIHQSGSNLLKLINDILDLSKIESGKMEIHYEHADPQRVLADAVEEMRPLARGKHLRLHFDAIGEGRIWCDPDRLRQVFLNLLGNAIKFTEHGFVEVKSTLDIDAERLAFSVRDSGIGIAEENQEAIFQEFRQVDGSAARRFGGTGLGLAICRRLVCLMGGDIRVESVPGQGTTFTVDVRAGREKPTGPLLPPSIQLSELPMTPAAPAVGPRPSAEELRASQGVILVVEDDPTLLQSLVGYLSREGFEVRVAASGPEALRQLEDGRPDLMVLDLMLPGLSGFEVLARITGSGGRALVPVVVHTAKDLTSHEWEALDRCVERVFLKGQGGVRLLVEEIHRLVETRKERDEYAASPGSGGETSTRSSAEAGRSGDPGVDRAAA